jgi:serine/threonine protein kinase
VDNATSEHRGETTRLGSFEILRRLARGGMAEIYLARTTDPAGAGTLVVLKKILPKYAEKPRYVQLFLEEAKLAASLDHPNIARVYDIGFADGSYFFAMEYLHGQDLRSILHRTWRLRERFPIEHAVQIARHVASALHFAHEQRRDGALLGIVHRDVSPSNVIVTYDGATKLLDFGVAKTAASTVKTRTGTLKGKISYMSPEQARGAPIDRRSDIFALGIVLWEMVTTQRLYRADNDLATLQLIITRPPRPPSSVCPDCPPELERIVLRALAQDPDARYPTAEQLVVELDELARAHELAQSPAALAATLGQLFGPELAAWRQARDAGVPLAEHLHEAASMTMLVSESDFIDLDDALDEDADDLEDASEIDDDDLTEHAAPIIDPLSPLASESVPPMPAALAGGLVTGTLTAPGAPTLIEPGAAPGALTLIDPGAAPDAATLLDLGAAPPAATSTLLGPPGPPVVVVRGIAVGPLPTPVPAPGRALSASPPLGISLGTGSPFSAPPWQSGQRSPLADRPRPWSIVELPAIDPGMFERQRRIVLRVAAGLAVLVILLAILAGRC